MGCTEEGGGASRVVMMGLIDACTPCELSRRRFSRHSRPTVLSFFGFFAVLFVLGTGLVLWIVCCVCVCVCLCILVAYCFRLPPLLS